MKKNAEELAKPVPIRITAHGIALNSWWRDRILHKARKLKEFYGRISACRIVVEAPHKHHHKGRLYNVHLSLEVPGRVIAINREPDLHLNAAIEKAFDSAERKLEDHARLIRCAVKSHGTIPVGRVVDLFPDSGYGFLETREGDRVYFHENSVLGNRFRQLTVGSEVRFCPEEGEKGPQASSVTLVKIAKEAPHRLRRAPATRSA